MAYIPKYSDPLADLESDLSDVSDVKPSDIDKILKSADDIDDDIFKFSKPERPKTATRPSKPPLHAIDDPLAGLDLSEEETPIKVKESKEKISSIFGLDEPKKKVSSGDWLGLKSPEVTKPERQIKTADGAKQRKRTNILDDLFGESYSAKKEETKTPAKALDNLEKADPLPNQKSQFFEKPSQNLKELKTDGSASYLPSASAPRRPERRLEPEKPKHDDWILRPKAPPSPDKPKTPLKTPKKQEQSLPEWLSSKKDEEIKVDPIKDGTQLENSVNFEVPQAASTPVQPTKGNPLEQLESVQAHLGEAMDRHDKHIRAYMKALLAEAERVGMSGAEPFKIKGSDPTDLGIKDIQLSTSKLELQIEQLEMKIESLETIKSIEIDTLKQTHEIEMSTWEIRFERTKKNYEEIIKEGEDKIEKLKREIVENENDSKLRLELMQKERMAEIEKLGEFHRIALEQAASITLPQSNGLVRLPVRMLQRPGDETELNDRETNLIEKEKQVEALKQELEAEKRELDLAIETEKVKRDERERQTRRLQIELDLKKEQFDREIQRKTENLKVYEDEVTKMRDEAIQEQAKLAKEKLMLAAEQAKLKAAAELGGGDSNVGPLDMLKARAELEAALQSVNESRQLADSERRRYLDLKKSVEEITWEQKEKDEKLDMRERHVHNLLKEIEIQKETSVAALNEAQKLQMELIDKKREIDEARRQIESREKIFAQERIEIAREKLELEKQKTQLEILLPELNPDDELFTRPPPSFNEGLVDPRAIITKLRAEKDLQNYKTRGKY